MFFGHSIFPTIHLQFNKNQFRLTALTLITPEFYMEGVFFKTVSRFVLVKSYYPSLQNNY